MKQKYRRSFSWRFSGLNVQILHCELDSVELLLTHLLLSIGNKNYFEHTLENREIRVYRSFRSLELDAETRAEITDYYIDAKHESRPTLLKSGILTLGFKFQHLYRPHPKDGEGNSFTLLVCPRGGVRSSRGVRSKVNPARRRVRSSRGGGVRSKVNPAGGVSGPARGGVRSKVNPAGGVSCPASRGGQVQPGGGGPVQRGGGQHLVPSCGWYASCVHARRTFLFSFKNRNGPTVLTAGFNSHVSIEASLFFGHITKEGVLYLNDDSYLEINNTSFKGNTHSTYQGAINMQSQVELNVTNCIFEDNSARVGVRYPEERITGSIQMGIRTKVPGKI